MLVDEISVKIALFGEGGVGKTSIVNSFLKKEHIGAYLPTIGSNITKKEYHLKKSEIFVKLNLWDVGGQKSFNPLNPVYFANLDAVFLVFDLTKSKETLLELKNTYLNKITKSSEKSFTFLIGNKVDLIKDKKDLESILDNLPVKDIPLIFTSAKTNENIQEIFELIIFTYLEGLARKIPKDKYKVLAREFLELIGKKEEDLKTILVNLKKIESYTIQSKLESPITKKLVEEPLIKDVELGKIQVVQQRLKKLESIKDQIVESFTNNLVAIKDIIVSLKQTPIGSLMEAIDNAAQQLNYFKDDFELKLESLLKLEGGETIQPESEIKIEKEGLSSKELEKKISGE